jgi:hypothetical protein
VSGGREGFLSRWSRLKREPDAPAARPDASAGAPDPSPLPEGKTLDDLLAELPRLEDLVPGQSLTAFMQPWVPTGVRNAALRRMWLLDPAIRDYVSPALDYAYDYNTPGGAPGFGTMETGQDAIREVAEMFDRALGKTASEASAEAPADAQDNLSQAARETPAAPHFAASQQDGADPTPAAQGVAGGAMADLPKSPPASSETAMQGDVAAHNNANAMNDLRPRGRRHGGALPG